MRPQACPRCGRTRKTQFPTFSVTLSTVDCTACVACSTAVVAPVTALVAVRSTAAVACVTPAAAVLITRVVDFRTLRATRRVAAPALRIALRVPLATFLATFLAERLFLAAPARLRRTVRRTARFVERFLLLLLRFLVRRALLAAMTGPLCARSSVVVLSRADGPGSCRQYPHSVVRALAHAGKIGSAGRTRTCDLGINSPSLYRLSYGGTGKGGEFSLSVGGGVNLTGLKRFLT